MRINFSIYMKSTLLKIFFCGFLFLQLSNLHAQNFTHQTSVIEFLGKLVPGYDYRAKRSRLNTDRSVREKLARELRKSAVNLKEVSDLAYRDGKREVCLLYTSPSPRD